MKKIIELSIVVLFALNSTVGLAAIPATAPYMTDTQNEYVQDTTTDAINTVNMILCIVNGMGIADSGMLNKGAYVALIDMNKCNSKSASGGSSTTSGASASVNYMNAIVDATRASNTAPMIAKVWMSMTEQGKKQDIWVKLTATTPPSTPPDITLPYGVFRLDFIGKDVNSVTQMNGFIDSASGSLQYYETGTNSSNVALNMNANLSSGVGTMTIIASPNNNMMGGTYNFNFNPTTFRRSDGTNDQCFDRLKTNAKRSVWRYGTYDAATGVRVDQPYPSFQVTATYAGATSYGYASYWGIGFQGFDLNAISTATGGVNPIPGLVVTDQRPSSTATYDLSMVKGKLTKWTKVASTLAALDGIPVNFYGNLTGLTVGNTAVATGFGNWQIVWNNVAGTFTVTGSQVCGPTGCTFTPIPAPVTTAALNTISISGWADSFGGNLNIPATVATAHVGTDPISYFSQSTIIPGSANAPTNLSCLNNCLDVTSVNGANAYAPAVGVVQPSPFNPLTTTQWGSGANIVPYTYAAGGLLNGTTPMIISNAAFFALGTNYQWGVQSGRLFDASVAALPADKITACAAVGGFCEPSSPAYYYTWSTSPDQWNQTMWLTNKATGVNVTFDPPQNMSYTVPNDAVLYGTWANKAVQLQFNGFGNIGGIPGFCVNPVDNTVVNCGPNTRYVPAFAIPDGATMSLTTAAGTTNLIVKALDAEVRLKNLGVGATVCSGLTLTPLTPPAGGTHDMSLSTDPFYIGIKPTITPKPKVIDGVKQY